MDLSRIEKVRQRVLQARDFVVDDVWDLDLGTLPKLRARAYAGIRMAYLIVHGFMRDRLGLQAASLTYYTLMSVIPILAIVLPIANAIAREMGVYEDLEKMLTQAQGELGANVEKGLSKLLHTAESANLAGLQVIGIVLLLYTGVKMIGRIERSFNAIWGVSEHRPLIERIAYYSGVIAMAPLVVVLVTAANTMLVSEAGRIEQWLGPFAWISALAVQAVGTLAICLMFTLVYMLVPNIKVRWTSAAIGGVVGGLLWVGWQWLCFHMQAWLTGYDKLWGTAAFLPMSLMWLQVNWLVVLFGGEVSFAWQNHRTFVSEAGAHISEFATRRELGLALVHDIVRRYRRPGEHWRLESFHEQHHVPIRLLRAVLQDLRKAGVLAVLAGENEQWVPGRDPANLTPADVEAALAGSVDVRVSRMRRQREIPAVELANRERTRYLERLGEQSFEDIILAEEGAAAAEES